MAVSVQSAERRALVLTAEPISVVKARGWIDGLAAGLVADDRRAELRLVMTEVVTNAVRHGAQGGTLRLAATPKPDFLCVQVTDDGAGLVPRPGAMASDENGGFGLFIVEQLARRWGVTREDRCTRVWFEFDYLAAT
jgi:anti-sigma regulatory factor (Ser/Thr protein kinase)